MGSLKQLPSSVHHINISKLRDGEENNQRAKNNNVWLENNAVPHATTDCSWSKVFPIHVNSGHTEGHPCSQDKGPFEEPKHEIQPIGRASVSGKIRSRSAGGLCEGEYGIREVLIKRSMCLRRKSTDGE